MKISDDFLTSADSLCSSPYAFERYPQSLLIGHAMKVMTTSGLSECLSRCLTAAASLNTQCRSLMYFYETGECIINRERRTDRPDLFVDGVQDQLVDYFENNCLDVHCFAGQLHWIRTEEYSISHDKDVIIESMSMEECRTVCHVNLIGTERFPCKAFVFNAAKRECHLTAESGYTGHRGNSFNLNPISSGEYFEKYCLQVSFACIDASFELVPDRKMTSLPYKDLCSLSETSQFSHPELFVLAENMDYFDKICDPAAFTRQKSEMATGRGANAVEGVTTIPQTNAIDLEEDDRVTSLSREDEEEVSKAVDFILSSTPSIDALNVVDQRETEAVGTVIDDTADFESAQRTNAVKARQFFLFLEYTEIWRRSNKRSRGPIGMREDL
ncbi:PAN domain protein [Necator americanus]|uniref:PAN domain protein n=1 Tax=Necator americanus TaxID=51031 RepID=W2SPF8_NECAM|nr:PAN domain protein [Necator americanus]ETN71579.1 PAN domain protein [Necator americanus]